MEPIIEEFNITLKYQVKVDTETGEMTTKCISRKIDKSNFEVVEDKPKRKVSKTKKEESSEPTLILGDNKYCLNQAAVELMGVEPDCKLDIKYKKKGNVIIPVIGDDEVFGTHNGNKLTKSLTVACRGSKNSELAKYGTEFTIVPYEEGTFILQSKDAPVDNETDIELPVDVDLQDLIDDVDATVTEVDSKIFQL